MCSRFKMPLLTLLLTGILVYTSSPQVVSAASSSCNWMNGRSYGPASGAVGYGVVGFDMGDTFTITHTGTAAQATVEAPNGTPVAVIPQGGSATFTLTTAGVTSLYIYNYTGSGDIAGSIACGDAPVSDPSVEVLFNPGDGRINHHVADRAAPAAVYCQYGGVLVIRIDPVTAKGTDEIRLTAADIEKAGVPADDNIILAQTDWAIVSRLADGRFGLNTWYADGKPYTMTWVNCNDSDNQYLER